jgi:GNAT superfamily N-acetyltransferase
MHVVALHTSQFGSHLDLTGGPMSSMSPSHKPAALPGPASIPIVVLPADQTRWKDLEPPSAPPGYNSDCWRQRFRSRGRDWDSKAGHGGGTRQASARTDRLRPARSDPDERRLLGRGPRGLVRGRPPQVFLRLGRAPWVGRRKDRSDGSVSAVVCLVTRKGFRRRGVSRALAQRAVEFARERGARALEAYPMLTMSGKEITWVELHVGSRSLFAAAGLVEVSHPSLRRVVMCTDF